jgi:hypothetical protein
MPEIRSAADRSSAVEPAAAPGTDLPEDRFAQVRLFELVLGVLDRLARITPVVLVVDDLHWADPSTRDLVAFLVRNLRDERVLLLATIRTDASDPGGASYSATWRSSSGGARGPHRPRTVPARRVGGAHDR